ncbi:MAG: hypothetical protein DMG76_06205 [Acidobacteria bacterium]|nr:MAG: hypothetical protein DMG76_06205 [Acidobacteriota bacterium]
MLTRYSFGNAGLLLAGEETWHSEERSDPQGESEFLHKLLLSHREPGNTSHEFCRFPLTEEINSQK